MSKFFYRLRENFLLYSKEIPIDSFASRHCDSYSMLMDPFENSPCKYCRGVLDGS